MSLRKRRLRNIHTPARRDKTAPNKRPPSENDGPNIFQLIRRAELLGESIVIDGKTNRPRVSGSYGNWAPTTALERLTVANIINNVQFRAGLTYCRLRHAYIGSPGPTNTALAKVIAEHLDAQKINHRHEETPEEREDRQVELKLEYERGDNHLRRLPHHTKIRICLRAVCIDNLYPTTAGWMARLKFGLKELAKVWKIEPLT